MSQIKCFRESSLSLHQSRYFQNTSTDFPSVRYFGQVWERAFPLGDPTQLYGTPLGISTNILPKLSLVEAVYCFHQYKFKHIELQLEFRARYDYALPEVERFLEGCKLNFGMDFTVHAPYLKINLGANDEDLRSYSCLQVATLIPFCAELGVRYLTVHTSGRGAHSLEQLLRSLELLVSQTQKYGICICLENTGADRPGWLLLTDEECITACYTTGCALTTDFVHVFSLKSDPFATLEKLLPFTRNCHLADTYDSQHLHLPLGKGNLPVHQILAVLDKHSYRGKLIVDALDRGYRAEEYIACAAAFRDN
ncbi:hypothetical protein RIVM261_051620 [Rivularia sp. IAM M-261]|nr:hypothetical protein RIVM261_051620 [Rivularia sp. IAM M-261]